jgi:dUTP pyrophosphatase
MMESGALVVHFLRVDERARLPTYATSGSAGADLAACIDSPIQIPPLGRSLIPTGLCIELPEGYEAQVRPRSGLAAKSGVTILNAPGTIDSDYRGEIRVILINLGSQPFSVQDGDRIAQLVIAPVTRGRFQETSSVAPSERGDGGFGSTGV